MGVCEAGAASSPELIDTFVRIIAGAPDVDDGWRS